jgi:molybdopterin-binding protein
LIESLSWRATGGERSSCSTVSATGLKTRNVKSPFRGSIHICLAGRVRNVVLIIIPTRAIMLWIVTESSIRSLGLSRMRECPISQGFEWYYHAVNL